jgi:hypothetical protein
LARSALGSDEHIVLETIATVYYIANDQSARGTLFLLDNGNLVFVTRRLLVFGYERHHEYHRSQILKVEPYDNGFKTFVQFEETDEEPEEVIGFFYEFDQGIDRWVKALSKHPETARREPSAPSTQKPMIPIIVRERVIKEIVKVPCSHCGKFYDQTLDSCPYCGGRFGGTSR